MGKEGMKVAVSVKTRGREEKVEKTATGYKVSVKVLPVDGKANEAVRKLLAKHLGVPPSSIELVSGHTSKNKVFAVFN